jgi:hypothetical protein
MESLQFNLEVERPTSVVFDVMSELENDAKWQSAVVEVRKLTRGAPGAGSRYLHHIDVLGKVVETASEFVSFEQGRRYAIHSVCGPFTFQTSVTFSVARSATHLGVLIEGRATNALSRLAAVALSGHRRKEIAQDLDRLKHLLESGAL